MSRKSLELQQLARKLATLAPLQKVAVPPIGWMKAIRQALGMTAEQLGHRLSVTRQGIHDAERREQNGSITLRSLRETARALNMQLVYAFIPDDGSLDALIERKAKELATQIVMRTSASMRLEDQENTRERLQQAIEERTEEIKNEMPKALWD